MTTNSPNHIVIERGYGINEVWSRCPGDAECSAHHRLTATCKSSYDAHRIADALNDEDDRR